MPKRKQEPRIRITKRQRWVTYGLDNFACVNCGESNLKKLSIDHVVPMSLGGKNNISNYQTLCCGCNAKKRDYPNLHLQWVIDRLSLANENINEILNFMATIDFYAIKVESYKSQTKQECGKMKTAVIMKRPLFGQYISQNSKTEFFSLTELVAAGNRWRALNDIPLFSAREWFRRSSSKEFMDALESKYGKIRIIGRGRGNHTWVHPLLFIDIALAISPKLKIEVYEWVYDNLLKIRNDSGDSYKRMCGALYVRISRKNKSQFPEIIADVAIKIQQACGVKDWQRANEEQLKMRDKCHDNIALLTEIFEDFDEGVRRGLLATMKAFGKPVLLRLVK